MKTFKRQQKTVVATVGALALLLHAGEGKAASWQDELQSRFDVVDTFDELQDWTPGGQWFSGAGCDSCASNSGLPKKIDGSGSIWGIWNNKGLSFEYTPQNGNFAVGDLITGATSGATATVRKVSNLDGRWYIQLTNNNQVSGSFRFAAGETISSGTKAGTNLQWPLFIANHGPANTWRGTGKSLVLDLGDNNNTDPLNPAMAGLGAQRLGTYFGDGISGRSGYKKVHAFFMMKVSPSFFNKCLNPGTSCLAQGYDPVSVVKVFDLNSGFTAISKWGTSAERAEVSANPTTQARLDEYGLNFSVLNFGGGGLSQSQNLFFAENNYVTAGASPNCSYLQTTSGRRLRSGTVLDIESYVQGGEWFGIEIASDIGTKGNSDGSTDFWIYDGTGKEMGHFAVTGQNRLLYFDHLYNKLVLGGNRLSSNGKTGNLDSRWWIDDVIIHGSRIGTAYFRMLSGEGTADTTAPAAAVTAPCAGATVSGIAGVSVDAADDVGVTMVEFYVNGVLSGSGTASPFNWDTRALANGSYNLTAKAYDDAGNVGASAALPVSVYNAPPDSTAPSVSIASPAGGSSVNGAVTVSVAASDNVAVSKVELYVNGAIYGVYGTVPYDIPWNTSVYPLGSCTLQAKAYDAAGNLAWSSPVPVVIADVTAPAVTAFAMPATARSFTVPCTAFTASDDVAVTGYLITESSTPPDAGAAGWSAVKPLRFTFPATGVRTAYAWVKDEAGNVSACKSATVIVDGTVPVITSLAPTGGSYALGSTIRITASAGDAIALSHMKVSVDSSLRIQASGGTISYDWKDAGIGTHLVSVAAYDKVGNQVVRNISIVVE